MKQKEFDFLDYYYNKLKTNQKRAYFRELVCEKTGASVKVFYMWIHREKVPSYAEIHIQDLIKEPKYNLPKYK